MDLLSNFKTRSGKFKYLSDLKPIARANRKVSTSSEAIFWQKVLRYDQTGFRFLRQKPLNRFILDFYCSKLLLAIEIDGGSHLRKKQLDNERDKYLLDMGIKTIRFKDEQIFTQLENVAIILKDQIREREIELNLKHI